MRYAIFADVHSNLEAIDAVENTLKGEKIDECLCLGDIVGYGANPGECIDKVRRLASIIIAGNHDWAVAGKFDIGYFNIHAKKAALWTGQNITKEEKNFLSHLPLIYETQLFTLAHGALIHPEDFGYVLDRVVAGENMQIQKTPFCFIGHSHIPKIYTIPEEDLVLEEKSREIIAAGENKYLINVGSVGQPRDGDPRAAYCIFDTDKKSISIKRVEYDATKACNKILAAGLPQILAYRLLEGK